MVCHYIYLHGVVLLLFRIFSFSDLFFSLVHYFAVDFGWIIVLLYPCVLSTCCEMCLPYA